MGNGYIRINTYSYNEFVHCQKCKSQGEIISQEKTDDVGETVWNYKIMNQTFGYYLLLLLGYY